MTVRSLQKQLRYVSQRNRQPVNFLRRASLRLISAAEDVENPGGSVSMAVDNMDFGERVRSLGAINAAPLRDRILSQPPDAWSEFGLRQRTYDVHHDTESIVLVFCDEAWPEVTVSRQPGWDRLADLAIPLMHELIGRAYPKGGTILRAMAAKLKAGGRIKPHVDALQSFRAGHRIHVPLTTNPGVRFTLDGRPLPMLFGEACEINNQKVHSVMNAGKEDRISFIFDYLPPEA